jgi:hypothetical protein
MNSNQKYMRWLVRKINGYFDWVRENASDSSGRVNAAGILLVLPFLCSCFLERFL